MIDDYDVTEDLQGSDEMYEELGDGAMKPGVQIIYIDRYTLNRNKKSGKPQLIMNFIGADDALDNRSHEASCWFPVVTKAWAEEDPSMKAKARFLKAFFTGLDVVPFQVSKLKETLDGMLKMPFRAKVQVRGEFTNVETLGFCDGATTSVNDSEVPF